MILASPLRTEEKLWCTLSLVAATHFFPMNDLHGHMDEDCHCMPRSQVADAGRILWVHNAFDGRDLIEAVERGEEIA